MSDEFDLTISSDDDESLTSAVVDSAPKAVAWWKLLLAGLAIFLFVQNRQGNEPPNDGEAVVVDDSKSDKPTGDLWLLCVYESEDNDSNFLSVYENKPYRDGLKQRGLEAYFQDQHLVSKKYLTAASKVGLPAFVVVNKSTKDPVMAFKQPEGGIAGLDQVLKDKVGR